MMNNPALATFTNFVGQTDSFAQAVQAINHLISVK
jgi:hypothetical protein